MSHNNLTPWERVEISRSAERPTSLDYITTIFDRYMSLHGDRLFGDDGAIVGGLASIDGIPVTVVGQQKGRSTKENIKRNFGMPSPEGYRKTMRLSARQRNFTVRASVLWIRREPSAASKLKRAVSVRRLRGTFIRCLP